MKYYYYSKSQALVGALFLVSIHNKPLETMTDTFVLHQGTTPFIGYPIVEGHTIRPATRIELIGLGRDELAYNEKIENGVIVIIPDPEPPVLTLHEQALQVQLTKRELVIIMEYLTSTQEGLTPITYETIVNYVASSSWVTKREWDLCTYIERSHALLDIVSGDFGISSEMLDYMFVHKDELLTQAEAYENAQGAI